MVKKTEKGEKVVWYLYGKYDIALSTTKITLNKTETREGTYALELGSSYSTSRFDPLNVRRDVYSGTLLEAKVIEQGGVIDSEKITNRHRRVEKHKKNHKRHTRNKK